MKSKSSELGLLIEELFDLRHKRKWILLRLVERDNLAFSIDDELGPAPWNILSLLCLCIEQLAVSAEEPVDRVCVRTIDFYL